MQKRRLKKKYRILLNRIKALICIMFFVFIIYFVLKLLFNKTKYIDSVLFLNNFVTINLIENDDIYCIISDKEPDLTDNWVKSEFNKCKLNYSKGNIFLKKDDKIIYISDDDVFVNLAKEDTIYIALNDKYNYYPYILGNSSKIKNEYDKKIINIDEKGIIKALKIGSTTLSTTINNQTYKKKIIVSNLITARPSYFDYDKEYLSCNKYSINDNNELDKILKNRIDNVGYKTRAAAVEAARFLTLDFPYRINYFYENGRQTTNKVDGEGRYYHVGLYLNKDRFKNLTGSTTTNNKGVWGCSIYSYPAKRNIDNGLDCSGFVSWALLNAGFDVKDVGAGWSNDDDLTDYGEVVKITKDLSTSNKIKVGDLLHSEKAGGHIGIIVGIDDEYYYIAQALWFDEIGVIITKRKKEELSSEFPHVVLMDKYYIEDGILTNMW